MLTCSATAYCKMATPNPGVNAEKLHAYYSFLVNIFLKRVYDGLLFVAIIINNYYHEIRKRIPGI